MRQWRSVPSPLLTLGEDNAAAPLDGGRAQRVENGIFTGTGSVIQVPDWVLADTSVNGSGTENNAVCGGFPFATQGGASDPSGGVAFGFNAVDDAIYLHQLGEEGAILRTLTAYTSYLQSLPPQMTGFDMFGRAYFCEDGREAVTDRKGLAYFDPTGAGSVVIPTFDVGGGAASLKFKGIAKHLGGTILGWGYFDNSTPDVPECIRFCKYGDPTTWVPDGDPDSAGFFNLGTPGLPVIACAASGQFTVLGKSSEVFVLSGAYEDQFDTRQIGVAHGPVSVNGMASNGPMAAWMSAQGPAFSQNGSDVRLLAHPRVLRRMGTYLNLPYCSAWHDAVNTRFLFLNTRGSTLEGVGLDDTWGTQLLCWDYERDAISVHNTPTTCWVVFGIDGPGVTLAGPSGTPANLSSAVTSTSAELSWDHSSGDPTAQVSVEFRIQGTSTFTVAGPTSTGATTWLLSGLLAGTIYEWRLRYFKNAQFGAYTGTVLFVTNAASDVSDPSDFHGLITNTYPYGGKTYSTATFTWTQGEFASGALTEVFENTVNDPSTASLVGSMSVNVTGMSLDKLQSPTGYYYWVRNRLGAIVSHRVTCTENPIVYGPL